MSTTNQILARLIAALQLKDPAWDISVGSPEYTILEAVANELATQGNTSTLQTYSLDINTMSGSQLDDFVANFGIYRLQGQRATGSVIFSTGVPATTNIAIPLGTQVYVPAINSSGVYTYFQTTAPGILLSGTTSIQIPIEATLTGQSGNLAASSITGISTNLVGITSVTNPSPTSGGQDPETDAQLIARFQATVFRNLSGSSQQMLSTVLNAPVSPAITQANVVGPIENFIENAQIGLFLATSLSTGTFTLTYNGNTTGAIAYNASAATIGSALEALAGFPLSYSTNSYSLATNVGYSSFAYNIPGIYPSTPLIGAVTASTSAVKIYYAVFSDNPDAQYIYPEGGELVSNPLTGAVCTNGVDYTYFQNGGTPPLAFTFTLDSNNNPINYSWLYPGNVVNLQSQYCSSASRNTPNSSPPIINKVDVFANTSQVPNPTSTTVEVTYNSANTFTSLGTSNFVTAAGSAPTGADVFVRLPVSPVAGVQTISISGTSGSFSFGIPTDNTQTLTLSNATGGTLEFSISGSDSPSVAYNATASQIQQVLQDAYYIPVEVTGGPLNTAPVYISYSTQTPGSGTFSIINSIVGGTPSISAPLSVNCYQVFDATASSGSPLEVAGIGITSAASVTNGALLTINYNVDSTISSLNDNLQAVRLTGQDVLMHRTSIVPVIINLVISYGLGASSSGTSQTAINTSILNALQSYFGGLTYQDSIYAADIIQTVMQVGGIQNCRIATSSDNPIPGAWGISVLQPDLLTVNTTLTSTEYVPIKSNQIAQLVGVNTTIKTSSL